MVAVGVTVAIERFGGVVGGLLGTIPTTIVPAAVGIWVASPNPDDLRGAMAMVPLGMAINALFLYTWRVLPPRLGGKGWGALATTTAVGLGIWFGAALLSVWGMQSYPPDRDVLWVGVWAQVALIAFGLWASRAHVPAPKGKRPVGLFTLLSRGLLAAAAIGFSTWLAALGSPLLAGVASVFPAIFMTTMVSLWLAQGRAVPLGAVGPMILGSGSVGVYALLAAWSLPLTGQVVGSAIAWGGSVVIVTGPAYVWLRRVRPDEPA